MISLGKKLLIRITRFLMLKGTAEALEIRFALVTTWLAVGRADGVL